MTAARRVALWGPFVAYLVGIFVASAQHDVSLPGPTTDKQWHAAAYMGLAITATRALNGGLTMGAGPAAAVAGWILSAGYGATDEWHQSFVAGRSSDRADWYADAIGAALGAGACWAWGIIRARADV